MTTEEFAKRQEAMSNEELIKLADKQVSELAKTGGKSHRMSSPPQIIDTDVIFCELIKRFEKLISNPICQHCGKYKTMQGNGIMHQLCECGVGAVSGSLLPVYQQYKEQIIGLTKEEANLIALEYIEELHAKLCMARIEECIRRRKESNDR